MTTVDAPPELTRAEVRQRITEAVAAGREGMAIADLADAERGGWCTQLIDQAIAWFAQTGERFSANDIRELLPPDFPAKGLMGSRFNYAANYVGSIRAVTSIRSTKKNTHGKPVGLWVGIQEPS